VAVTRAKLRCYIFWADVKPAGKVADSFSSALGYLLFPDGYIDFRGQQTVLQSFAEQRSVKCLVIPDCTQEKVKYRRDIATADLAPRQPSGRSLHTDWQISSYSAMASLSEHDEQDRHLPTLPPAESARIPCPGLPVGANFGNVIHNILEAVPFASIASGADISEQLARECTRYRIGAEAGLLQRLLHILVTTPLSAVAERGFSLATLIEERCVREMPFYFHPDRIVTKEINTILAAEPTVTPLAHKVMQGYLTGFVDLFCEYQGKYYIIDYKTNFLGDSVCDYSPENLVRAMEAHNYGLQYWIYTLVLHQFLKNVLPEYTYERHFGGVLYLFVRGIIPAIPGSGVYFTLPDKRLLDRLCVSVEGRQ